MTEWNTNEEAMIHRYKELGFTVKEIARRLHRRTEDVCDKLNETEYVKCSCCHRDTPHKYAYTYVFNNGTEETVCASCAAVVDWYNDQL